MKVIKNIIKNIVKLDKLLMKVKTAVVLILIIILASIAGTVILQNRHVHEYSELYGKFFGKLILITGLNDVYHSWWFVILLVLLTMSIILCSYKRAVRDVKNIFFPDLGLKTAGFDHKFKVKDPGFKSFEKLLRFFKKNHFKINYKNTQSKTVFQLQKNILNALGSDIIHLSIIIILIGSFFTFSPAFGDKYNLKILKGQTVKVPKTDIQFRLDNFTVEFYEKSGRPTGRPKLFRSDISIIDKNGETNKRSIEVNKPLTVKGIQFSQNSYGFHGFETVFIGVKDNKLKKNIGAYKVKMGDIIELPNSYKLRVDDYIPDFRISEDKKIFSFSKEPDNPALKITIFKKGSSETFWTFLKFPMMSASHKKARFGVKFMKLTPNYYTVLMAVKDPGLEIVLIGFILLSIGVFAIFLINYNKYIVVVEKSGKSNAIIKINGICKRKDNNFKEKFEKLIKEIKEIY